MSDVTKSIVNNYYVSVYVRQKVDLTKIRVEDLFGREKERKIGEIFLLIYA